MEQKQKYSFLWVSIAIIVVISVATYYFFHTKKSASPASKEPEVSLEITHGNILEVRWQNLDPNAQFLNIYEIGNGTKNVSLVKSVPIADNTQNKGSAEVPTNNAPLDNKSLYVQAVNGTSGQQQTIIWTSPPIIPSPPGSTPQNPPGDGTGTQPSNPSSTPPDSTPTFPAPSSTAPTSTTGNPPASTSTPPDNSPSPSSTPTSTVSNPPAPTSTTSTPPPETSFQVSNSNAWVTITWQYLPPNTVSLEISRSINPGGPWSVFYATQNPEIIGPYRVSVPETTTSTAFFYKLTAHGTSTIVGTNGPIFLSASKM